MADFRALCAELLDEFVYHTDWSDAEELKDRARDALADGPAVPDGREPAAITGQPSDEELLETLDKATATFPPRHPEAEGLNAVEYPLALELRKARAVLARWGTSNLAETRSSLGGMPTPVPADKGEVAELVRWLRSRAGIPASPDFPAVAAMLTRAANLLEQRHPAPVPVSERLPGPEDCNAEGRCWLLTVEDEYPQWRLHSIQGAQSGGAMIWVPVDSSPGVLVDCFYTSHWLPAHALPIPHQQQQQENTNDH